MKDHGGGAIVNIGSGCNKLAFPDLVAYTASKGGIEMFTKVAAVELGPHKIRVNCVAPGAVEVERTKLEDPDYAGIWGRIAPLGRVGTPADIGRALADMAKLSGRIRDRSDHLGRWRDVRVRAVGQQVDVKRRNRISTPPAPKVCSRKSRSDPGDQMTSPHGLPPVGIRDTVPLARLTTDTSSDGPLAVYTLVPSPLTSIPHGLAPTSSIVRVSARFATSMIAIALARPSETYTSLPIRGKYILIGRGTVGPFPFGRTFKAATTCFAVSMTLTVAAVSSVTNAVDPSFVNTTARGRAAVFIRPTTFSVVVSTANTSLSASHVTFRARLAGPSPLRARRRP